MSRKPAFPHKILWNPTRTRLPKYFKPCRIPHLLSEPSSFWSLVLFSRFAIQVVAEATPLSTSFLPLSLAPQGFASEEDRSREEEVVAKATLSDHGRRRNKVPLIHLFLLSCRNSLRRKRDDAHILPLLLRFPGFFSSNQLADCRIWKKETRTDYVRRPAAGI